MARYGSAAYDYLSAAPRRETDPRRAFEVIEGEGLDERARRGVAASTLSRGVIVAVAVALVFCLSFARVALCASTVGVLQGAQELRGQVAEAQEASDELLVERSVLSSSSRITRIATQNYGMVRAGEVATISIDDSGEGAAEAGAPATPAADAAEGAAQGA